MASLSNYMLSGKQNQSQRRQIQRKLHACWKQIEERLSPTRVSDSGFGT